MLFSLEALNARHGDALLLHFGTVAKPQLALIDGGPAGVWARVRGRLEALRASRAPGDSLPVALMMVSHIDDDHIRGVLDLTDHLIQQDDDGGPLLLDVARLWHNSFADVAGGAADAGMATVSAAAAASAGGTGSLTAFTTREGAAIVASIPQGKRLRANARKLQIPLNPGFGAAKLVKSGAAARKLGPLTLRVVGPPADRLAVLKKQWQAVKQAADTASASVAQALIAAYVDQSVANLSSIVVLARCGGKTMLLTGDARGDDMLAALAAAKLLKNDRLHVDLLKVQHHGSEHSTAQDFFERVTADHYLISADGKYGNPDVPTLKMIVAARGNDRYTLHFTNRVAGPAKWLATARKSHRFTVVYRAAGAESLTVNLGDALGT